MFDVERGASFEQPPQEIERAEPAVEAKEEKETAERAVFFEDLPKEEQERLLPEALAHMSKVLEGIDDYAVFASTAMYLNGEMLEEGGDKAGKELKAPPGDFDAAVFSEASLEKIRQQMVDGQAENLRFEFAKAKDGSDFLSIKGEEAKKLAGKLIFYDEIGKRPVKYDYEFFYKSKIVSPELAQGRTIERNGLKILNIEGLEKQYQKNLEFEGGLEERVGEIVQEIEALKSSDFRSELMDWDEKSPLSETTNHVLRELDVAAQDLKAVFKMQERIDAIDAWQNKAKRRRGDLQKLQATYREIGATEKVADVRAEALEIDEEAKALEDEKRKLVSSRAEKLLGKKTKVWKRAMNVLQLADIRSGDRAPEFKKYFPANASLGPEQPDPTPANTMIGEIGDEEEIAAEKKAA